MSEEKAFELIDKLPSKDLLDEDGEASLKEEIQKQLREDIRANQQIRKLLITPDTFDNSLGNLYRYLKDRNTCVSCAKKITSCPKEKAGYEVYPIYDSVRDEIRLEIRKCSVLAEIAKVIDHIRPLDMESKDLIDSASYVIGLLNQADNMKTMADTKKIILSALLSSKDMSKEKAYKGFAIHTSDDGTYAKKLLRAIAYIYAKAGNDVSYINTPEFYKCLNDKDYTIHDIARNDFAHILNIPVLILDSFDQYPRYLTAEVTQKQLFTLIHERNKMGKVTYLGLSSFKSYDAFFNSAFRTLDHEKTLSDLRNICENLAVRDLPL